MKLDWRLIVCGIFLFLCSCESKNSKWQGYNEAKITYIASSFSGVLKKLYTTPGFTIKENDPLFALELQPENDELKKAIADAKALEAQKKSIIAKLNFATIDLQRSKALLNKQAILQSEYDKVNADFQNANANLTKINANLVAANTTISKLKWSLNQKTIFAPQKGLILDTYYLEGEFVPAGKPVLALLSPHEIKTIFYVSESDVGGLSVGQRVMVSCVGCKNPIEEKITFISSNVAFTPPVIYSDDTRSKLVFRVEATPLTNDLIEFQPGQPVRIWRKKNKGSSANM